MSDGKKGGGWEEDGTMHAWSSGWRSLEFSHRNLNEILRSGLGRECLVQIGAPVSNVSN